MKAMLTTVATVLIVGGLTLVVVLTAQGAEDLIELVAIAAGAVMLGLAIGGKAATPRRRIRGFTRTPESDW